MSFIGLWKPGRGKKIKRVWGIKVVEAIDFLYYNMPVGYGGVLRSDLIPDRDLFYRIGRPDARIREIHAGTAYFDRVCISSGQVISAVDLDQHRNAVPIDHPDGSITDAKIANVSRVKIYDLWSAPFWDNIPDKPDKFPPEPHGSSHNIGGTDEIPDLATLRSDFDSHRVSTTDHVPSGKYICATSRSDQLPSWDDIPDKPSAFPPEEHTHTRSDITDFWSSPFWENIPDKPSAFPPESHTHTRSEITDFWSSPFWDNIPDKPSTFPPSAHASSHKPSGSDALFPANFHINPASDNAYDIGTTTLRWRDGWFANGLAVGDITSRADKLHVKSSPNTGILVESTGDHPAITLKGYDGTNYYSTKLLGAYHGRAIEWRHPVSGGYFMFVAPPATSDNPLQNCWKLWFGCRYWDGSASKYFNIQIIPEVLDTSPTGRLRFWMSVAGDVLTLHSSTGIISHKNVIPSTDNAFDLGSESYRWRSVHAVNGYFSNIVQVGDLVFNNGWRISEHEKYGLVLISPDGKMYKIHLEEVNNDDENKV